MIVAIPALHIWPSENEPLFDAYTIDALMVNQSTANMTDTNILFDT